LLEAAFDDEAAGAVDGACCAISAKKNWMKCSGCFFGGGVNGEEGGEGRATSLSVHLLAYIRNICKDRFLVPLSEQLGRSDGVPLSRGCGEEGGVGCVLGGVEPR